VLYYFTVLSEVTKTHKHMCAVTPFLFLMLFCIRPEQEK